MNKNGPSLSKKDVTHAVQLNSSRERMNRAIETSYGCNNNLDEIKNSRTCTDTIQRIFIEFLLKHHFVTPV